MLVDSHCHLDFIEGDLDQILSDSKKAGVEYMLSACVHLKHFPKLLEIAEQYPNIFISVGLQPSEQAELEPTKAELIKLANNPKVAAIGETGLDYHYDSVPRKIQQERFRSHIRAATEINKPLIIHSREASEDTIQILQEQGADKVGGVMHCFTESWQMAKQAMEMNFYISFSGIVTFKNANDLREVAKLVPFDKMLLETDAPYLAPVPHRGKPNQPAYLYYVAECIAELKNISYEDVAKQTTKNFFQLFT